jgi:hypothetical protein
MDLIRNIENLLKFKIKVEAQSLKIGEEWIDLKDKLLGRNGFYLEDINRLLNIIAYITVKTLLSNRNILMMNEI